MGAGAASLRRVFFIDVLLRKATDLHLLIVDNYDSFTYNLVDYFTRLGAQTTVVRNNALDLNALDNYSGIVLSPGPGLPSEAGRMPELIATFLGKLPILGVCLGHQAVCEHLGGRLVNLPKVLHGQSTLSRQCLDDPFWNGIPEVFETGHYHSWAVSADALGAGVEVMALNVDGWVMAVRHSSLRFYGVQFHPESILTPNGLSMLKNWLTLIQL